MARIWNSVGSSVFLTRHCGAIGEYRSVSVKAKVVNGKQEDVAASFSASEVTTIWRYTNVYIIIIIIRDRIILAVLECANCSLHAMVEAALSETVATVSLSTVPRLSLLPGSPVVCEWESGCAGEGRWCGWLDWLAVHSRGIKWRRI